SCSPSRAAKKRGAYTSSTNMPPGRRLRLMRRSTSSASRRGTSGTNHKSKVSEEKRHSVKHRLVLYGADIPLHELDCQARLVRSALGCSNGCWSEINARHQRAASRHRQRITPPPPANV